MVTLEKEGGGFLDHDETDAWRSCGGADRRRADDDTERRRCRVVALVEEERGRTAVGFTADRYRSAGDRRWIWPDRRSRRPVGANRSANAHPHRPSRAT